MRWGSILCQIVICGLVNLVPCQAGFGIFQVNGTTGLTSFQQFNIGDGGFSTGINIANDGTKVIRTDQANGAYVAGPGTSSKWTNLVTTTALPVGDATIDTANFVYEVAIAPSNSSHLYLYFNGYVYSSTNQGASWTRTGFSNVTAVAGDSNRASGRFMAVDPANENILIVGTPSSGAFITSNGGTSFTQLGAGFSLPSSSLGTSTTSIAVGTGAKTLTTNSSFGLSSGAVVLVWETGAHGNELLGTVTSDTGTSLVLNITGTFGSGTHTDWTIGIPQSANGQGNSLVAFDPASSVVGSATQGIYISTAGLGVYHSTDGGSTFTLTTSSPQTHFHMICDQNGIVWLVQTDNTLHKFASSTWSNVTAAGNATTVSVNPANGSNIVVGEAGGNLQISTDGGSTWTGQTPYPNTRAAGDIPWFSWTNEDFMTNGDMVFDPNASNVLYFAQGIGIWRTSPPTTQTQVTWTPQADGIELLDAVWAVSPPSGSPVFAFWDRPFFYGGSFTWSSPTCTGGGGVLYPCQHGVNVVNAIQRGASVDWCSSATATLVGIANSSQQGTGGADSSGISTNGGATWSTFSAIPADVNGSGFYGGSIACSDATHIIWVESNAGNAYYTTNGGTSWTKISIAGVSPPNGWGAGAYFDNMQNIAADRVNATTFYLYLNDIGGGNGDAVYKTTNGGSSWAKQSHPNFNGPVAFNSSLRSVPGNAGHLFFSGGNPSAGSHPQTQSFYQSTDGGATWNAIANVQEVWAFGFGKAKPGGGGYPSIYIFGWVSGVQGIWRSDDEASTWTKISDGFPTGVIGNIQCIEGDNNTYGTLYIGVSGGGVVSGHLN